VSVPSTPAIIDTKPISTFPRDVHSTLLNDAPILRFTLYRRLASIHIGVLEDINHHNDLIITEEESQIRFILGYQVRESEDLQEMLNT
jgi:hypothetical protein